MKNLIIKLNKLGYNKLAAKVTNVEAAENIIDQMKDILENGAKKIQGKMVDAYTASLIVQIYNMVGEGTKKKMENTKIDKLVTICWKMQKKLNAKS